MKALFVEPLQSLEAVLIESEEFLYAGMVNNAISGSEQELEQFLSSNELWGGSGSIADQAGCGKKAALRKKIEGALISLGNIQMKIGVLNERTSFWVDAFKQWRH